MTGEWTRELTRLQKEAGRMERLQADRVRRTEQTERAAREMYAAQGRAKILAQAAAYAGIDERLARQMRAAGVTPQQLQRVVCDMGYMPADMPARDYPQGFVDGWCLPNWGRICRRIRQSDKGETWRL